MCLKRPVFLTSLTARIGETGRSDFYEYMNWHDVRTEELTFYGRVCEL